MAWSFEAVGTPKGIVAELHRQNNDLTGHAKTEWDDAKKAIIALVEMNHGVAVEVCARGSASYDHARVLRTVLAASCQVSVRPLYGFLVS